MYKHYTVKYKLKKADETLFFNSEKEACEFLNVSKCSVASCYRRGALCKGYIIERGDSTTHHATKTRLHKIWEGMHARCYNTKHMHYKNYGGRGIEVCKEWGDFLLFKEWAMQNGYNEILTLDRINNNGNYEPNNCRWATYSEQASNKRTNHKITINGETMILAECSRKYNIPKSTIRWREQHSRNIITGAKMDGGESNE